MEETLMSLILTALGCSVAISGITQVVKQNTKLEGIWVIVFAVATGLILFGVIALIYKYPLPESLLTGFLSGLASVGAFNAYQQKGGNLS